MSHTLVEDGPVLQIRASITDRKELEELIAKLTKRLETSLGDKDDIYFDLANAARKSVTGEKND